MAGGGRPASSTPQQVAQRTPHLLRMSLSHEQDKRQARACGLGSLLGVAAGVVAGVGLGTIRNCGYPGTALGTVATAWVLAMAVGNGPMTVLG